MSETTCYICQDRTFSCDAGSHTHIDLCENSTEETSHGVCYSKLLFPKTCWCRTPLKPMPSSPPFVVVNRACNNCGEFMTHAGKRLTLQNPPDALAQKHGTFTVGGDRTYLCVCFGCLVAMFVHENREVIPSEYVDVQLQSWQGAFPDYADILFGAENANKAKQQLMMWVPNIPEFYKVTNLKLVLDLVCTQLDLLRFLDLMCNLNLDNTPVVRNYLKAQILKKMLSFGATDWAVWESIVNKLSIVFSRSETSEMLMQWLLHEPRMNR